MAGGGHRRRAGPAGRGPAAGRVARQGPRVDGGRHRRGVVAGSVPSVPRRHGRPGHRGRGPPGRAHPARPRLCRAHREGTTLGRDRPRRSQQRAQPHPAREGHRITAGRAVARRRSPAGCPARRHLDPAPVHRTGRPAATDGRRPRRHGGPVAYVPSRASRRRGPATHAAAGPASRHTWVGVRLPLRPRPPRPGRR